MQIDLPFHVVQKLENLLNQLSDAREEMDDSEYFHLYFDDKDSGDFNSDPHPFNSIERSTLDLAVEIKSKLKM